MGLVLLPSSVTSSRFTALCLCEVGMIKTSTSKDLGFVKCLEQEEATFSGLA
jgi:hypothetical protein